MPAKHPSKVRVPERDYSHRTLMDKLGVKPGQRIVVLGVEDAEFLRDLAASVPEYSRGNRINNADLLFFSAEARADLSQLKSLSRLIFKIRRDLGRLSARPKTHSRNRCYQCGEISRTHGQQSVPLLRHTQSPPLCHTSSKTLSASVPRVRHKSGQPEARLAFLHCFEEYGAEIFAAPFAVRLIMFLWR